MIVRLTTAQRDACSAAGSELHRSWIDQAKPVGKATWDVPMPPIGWKLLLDRLTEVAFNPYGQRRSRVSGATHRAITKIAQLLAHFESHPAFTRSALPGEHDTYIVGWPLGTWYQPYPSDVDDVGSAIALVPAWSTVGGIRVTTWIGYLPNAWPSRLLSPEAHLEFISASRPARASATAH